jgi:hypothetical protein
MDPATLDRPVFPQADSSQYNLDVRIFLAAPAEAFRPRLVCSAWSERRVARWMAFCGFGPVVQKAKHEGRRARRGVNYPYVISPARRSRIDNQKAVR